MNWISVKDRFPPLQKGTRYSDTVLVYCDDGYNEINIGYICWDGCNLDDDGNLDIQCDLLTAMSNGWGYWDVEGYCHQEAVIKYWMPLPEQPKES